MTQGECMRRARKRAGLTASQLSAMSGVPTQTISHLECDRLAGRIDTIELLADAMGMSIDQYVGHEVKG